MFLTFLNKEDCHSLDLSTFINCSPERILYYYYNSYIKISLATYQQMKEWSQNDDTNKSCLLQWLDFIDKELGARQDLVLLRDSEYLHNSGPYYYGPTNTRLYFAKLDTMRNEPLSSVDFAVLFNLDKRPIIDKDLHKYYKARKSAKKLVQNKESLIRDISMCLMALSQIENINRHCSYLNLLIKNRSFLLEENIGPREPDFMPERPQKPDQPELAFHSLLAIGMSRQKHKEYMDTCSNFNHQMKIYYLRSREFEKACERYKEALLEWNEYKDAFTENCMDEIEDAQAKLKYCHALLENYSGILARSFVHQNYHNMTTLGSFKYYLDTGRADSLQDCMNLWEEEKQWKQIKDSQDRIENTIHFIKDSNIPLTEQQSKDLIASTSEVKRKKG